MRAALLICVLSLGVCFPASAEVDDYLGATRCGSCHPKEMAIWARGPHKQAHRGLAAKPEDSSCRACHNTGDAPLGQSVLPGVQCEACHGAGVHYAELDIMKDVPLAQALGLRPLAAPGQREALCLRCHSASISLSPFDVEKAWREIAH